MIRKFLNLIGSKLREKRPLISDTHNYTIKHYGDFVHFWFRTQGFDILPIAKARGF